MLKWVVLFISLNIQLTYSQGLSNLWIMGYDLTGAGSPNGGCEIDFINLLPDTFSRPRLMNFSTTTASISDNAGNILFYTNGVFIADKRDSMMQNGDGLNPSFYTNGQMQINDGLNLPQSHIIIPMPGESGKYYLFHCTIDTFNIQSILHSSFLYYSIIDINQNGGNGEVISKNNVLLSDSLNVGGLSAVKHANGRDWWLVCHQFGSNNFIKFLITPYTLEGPFYQSIGAIRTGSTHTSVFSKDGTNFAIADGHYGIDVFNFDRCNGTFYNPRQSIINDGQTDRSTAFSPNGNVLYVTSIDKVYQYDLQYQNIDSTRITVAVWDSTYDPLGPPLATLFRICALAYDGKIYISTGNSTRYLHRINSPDSLGISCNIQQHVIELPTLNFNSIPYYPEYFLGADSGSICDSLTNSTSDVPKFEPYIRVVQEFNSNSIKIIISEFHSNNLYFCFYNSLGKIMMYEKILDGSLLNIENYKNGIYFWSIYEGLDILKNGKLILIK